MTSNVSTKKEKMPPLPITIEMWHGLTADLLGPWGHPLSTWPMGTLMGTAARPLNTWPGLIPIRKVTIRLRDEKVLDRIGKGLQEPKA